MLRTTPRVALVLAGALLFGTGMPAQEGGRNVVSSQIAVSSDEAALQLGFAGGGRFEVALRNGRVLVDGNEIGRYEPGGALDHSWRALLGDVVTLGDGPLASALREWSPPPEASALGARLDRALEEALASPAVEVSPPPATAESDVTALLRRASRLPGLAGAIQDLALTDVRLRVDEDLLVEEGTTLDATAVVVDGDVRVRGVVDGDLVLVGGTLHLEEGGRVTGEVRLVDSEMVDEGGEIVGELVRLDGAEGFSVSVGDRDDLEKRIRRELREELRRELRPARADRDEGAFAHWADHASEAIELMLGFLAFFAVLSLVGVGLVRFVPDAFDVVTDTVRRSPGRSAAVGAAGVVLFFPAWVLGIAALAISIVGILALPFWIPLFPLAAVLAAAFGYLAVGRTVGEWIVEQRFSWLEGLRLRSSNAIHTLFAGIGALLALWIAAASTQLAGHLLDLLQGILILGAVLVTVAATVVGFGAVILTRAGRRTDWGGDDLFGGGPLWPSGPTPRPEGPREPGFGHTGTRTGPETPGSGSEYATGPERGGSAGSPVGGAPGEVPTESGDRREDADENDDEREGET